MKTSGKILNDGRIFWHIENFTPDMDKFKVIYLFEEMTKIIQPYMAPTLTSTADPDVAQIVIRFKNNGDADLPLPFDNYTLAYAYLADNTDSRGLTSDIFFNDRFSWGEMHSSKNVDLLKVAVHECLHALGLYHSMDPNDILAPTYDPYEPIKLTKATRDALIKLYGERSTPVKGLYAELFPHLRWLLDLREDQLLVIAGHLGITAKKADLKRHTAEKIYDLIS